MKKVTVVIYHAPNFVYLSGKKGKVGCTQNLDKRKKESDMGRGVKILKYLENVTPRYAGDIEWKWAEKLGCLKHGHYSIALRRRMMASHAAGQSNKRSGQASALGRLMGPENGRRTGNSVAGKRHMRRLGKRMGKKQGRVNAQNGHMLRIQKIMNGKIRKCPHCEIAARGPGLFRWHFDNCKFKEK